MPGAWRPCGGTALLIRDGGLGFVNGSQLQRPCNVLCRQRPPIADRDDCDVRFAVILDRGIESMLTASSCGTETMSNLLVESDTGFRRCTEDPIAFQGQHPFVHVPDGGHHPPVSD